MFGDDVERQVAARVMLALLAVMLLAGLAGLAAGYCVGHKRGYEEGLRDAVPRGPVAVMDREAD